MTATTTGRIVVAGASMGGLRAAEQLRATGWTGTITTVAHVLAVSHATSGAARLV